MGGNFGRIESDGCGLRSVATTCAAILNRESVLPNSSVAVLGDIEGKERGNGLAGENYNFRSVLSFFRIETH